MAKDANHLTTKAFSEQTGIPAPEVAKRLREGSLKGSKKGGRWWIPASELDAARRPAAPPTDGAAAPPEGHSGPPQPAAANSFSVAEFSERTYLTETGVLQWLRIGRLKGSRTPEGEWRVHADNLDTPDVRRLRR